MNKIFINRPGKSTIVIVSVNTGSINEVDKYKGISHYVEHMCFKGNEKRTQKQISSAIDNVGGDINAFTDLEITAYWAKVGNTYKDLAIDVITDLATKAVFPSKEIDKEREVIIQELKMYEDNPKSHVYDIFNQVLYRKDSSFHLSTIGTKESLYNIKRQDILKYYKSRYNNSTLIIVGDAESKVEIDKPYEIEYIDPKINSSPNNKVLIKRLEVTQANILIGNTKLTNFTQEEKAFGLKLLSAIYGDMSGRLFDTIREKNNMVYRVHFEYDILSNGYIQWHVSAGLDKENIDRARDLIVKELSRPFSEKDLKVALTKTIGIEEMSLDNITNVGTIIAYSLAKNINYRELIYGYTRTLKKATLIVNDLIKEMNFNNNILVGIIPKQ